MEKQRPFSAMSMSSDVAILEDQSSIDLLCEEIADITRDPEQSPEIDIEECLTEEAIMTDSSDCFSTLSDSSDVGENVDEAKDEEIIWDETFDNLSELSLDSAMSSCLWRPSAHQEKITRQERLHMYELRHHLNILDTNLEEAEKDVCEKREELKKCKKTIADLQAEKDNVFKELEEAEMENKVTVLYRLKAHHKRITEELEQEMALKDQISEMLDKAEYSYVSADIDKGKFQAAKECLERKEQELSQEKAEIFRLRQYREELKAWRAKKNEEMKMSQHIRGIKQKELQIKLKAIEAEKAKASTAKYLKATIAKLQKEEEEQRIEFEDEMTQKLEMILALKQVMEIKKESMKKKIAKDKMKKALEKEQELEEREKIIEQGGNPDIVMMLKQRKKKKEQEQLKFEQKQTENYKKIVKKLFLEDKLKKKEEKHQRALKKKQRELRQKSDVQKPYRMTKKFENLFNETFPENKEMKDKEINQDQEHTSILQQEVILDSDDESEKDVAIMKKQVSEESADVVDEDDDDDDMAAPEFEGLWYRQQSATKSERLANAPRDGKQKSKMEKEIMERQMEKLRNPTVKKQMLAGKELQGCGFYGKPSHIHFENIDVGKTYKKKVMITNVFYTVNYIKLIGVSTSIQDFVQVEFTPPGPISAGMTCDLFVTFTPKLNEDLYGEVNFLSKTSKSFSIPLICSTKKCKLSVDREFVDFKTTVIEDVLKKTIILTNKGALGTEFEFFNSNAVSENQKLKIMRKAEENPNTPEIKSREENEHQDRPKSLNKSHEKSTLENSEGLPSELDMSKSGATAKHFGTTDSEVHSSSALGIHCDMRVGGEHAGYISAHSTVKLEIVWQPTIPGPTKKDFLITFSDTLSHPITVKAIGYATDVPVCVKEPSLDMKICMYDRLYQETIILFNRETSALKIRFEVAKEMRNHLEILPKIGYIQAKSQFQAQLKFLPRKSLTEDAPKYFDSKTSVLEAPITIWVAKHNKPVEFAVHAVVTSSDLQFSVNTIDFGHCTIHESVRSCIQLINKSLLPQEFGFVDLPPFVSVQPNDGFGTILPLETLDLDVLFQPHAAKEYNFELVCKTLINRNFCLNGKGIGIRPPLELSHQEIQFKETALYDESEAIIYVVSSLTQEQKEINALFRRTGKSEVAPMGPASFEFVVPPNVPIKISPAVGSVEPEKKVKVQVRFSPILEEEEIKKEGVKIATKILQAEADKKYQAVVQKLEKEKEEQALKKGPKKPAKPSAKVRKGKGGANSPTDPTMEPPKPVSPPSAESITNDTQIQSSVVTYLLRNYTESRKKYKIPCYIASGRCKTTQQIPYSIQNTLYLEVHSPTIQPPVIILSDMGKNHINFGDICVGHSTRRILMIQNITDERVDLTSSILDTLGPFTVKNALRSLNPSETLTLILDFAPVTGKQFYEVLELKSANARLFFRLTGRGIVPEVQFPFEDELLDMGSIMAGEFCQKCFKLENLSPLDIDYNIKLDSKIEVVDNDFHPLRNMSQELSEKKLIGPPNYNGFDVFDFVPVEGKIPAGGSKEIIITFAPDHDSDNFSDIVRIEFFRKDIVHSFQVIGQGKKNCVFVEGYDEMVCNTESLAFSPVIQYHEDDPSSSEKTKLSSRMIGAPA